MSYFHPRDFDPGQPVLKVPLNRRFKSYVGLKGAYFKFERWMAFNKFIDLRAAVAIVDWENVVTIKVF